MLDENEIKAHIETIGREFVVDVRIRAYDETILLYIPLDQVAPKVRKGFTSLRQIKNLKRHIGKHFSASVDVIFVQSDSQISLEEGIFQLLIRRFDNRIKSFYISFSDETTIDSWIEIEAQDLDDALKAQISEYLYELTNGAKLTLGNIQWVGAKMDRPSTPALLRLIKKLQPVTASALSGFLKEDYESVDHKWLKRTLDNLRRRGLLYWQRPGNYALTASSLTIVPAGTLRSSSDIERALALARRKW